MRRQLKNLYKDDKAMSSNRSILAIVGLTILIFVGSYVLSGGLARFSGHPTITASLNVTDSGLSTTNEKFTISISNVSGNLSLSDVKVSITDSYGTSVTQTFNKGVTSVQVEEGESNGVIPEYIYDMAANGSGNYLTNTTIITITVTNGNPTPVSKIALVDSLSDGTIGAWSP